MSEQLVKTGQGSLRLLLETADMRVDASDKWYWPDVVENLGQRTTKPRWQALIVC